MLWHTRIREEDDGRAEAWEEHEPSEGQTQRPSVLVATLDAEGTMSLREPAGVGLVLHIAGIFSQIVESHRRERLERIRSHSPTE